MDFKKNKIGPIMALLLLIHPILSMYSYTFEGISFGDMSLMIMLIISFFYIIVTNTKVYFNIPYMAFLFFLFVTSIIAVMFNNMDGLGNSISYMIRFIILSIYTANLISLCSFEKFTKMFDLVAIVNTIYLGLQLVFYYGIHIYLKPNPLRLPLAAFHPMDGKTISTIGMLRPSGFYMEPAWFATSMLLLLIIKMYQKKYQQSVIIGFAIMLTTSTLGIAVVAILFLINIIFSKRKLLMKISISLILGIMYLIFRYAPVMHDTYMRITESSGSSGQRLMRAWLITQKMKRPENIFGVGVNNLKLYVQSRGITTPYDIPTSLEWANTAIYIYISGGIALVIFSIVIMTRLFIKGDAFIRIFVVYFLILVASSAILNGSIWHISLTMLFMYMIQQKSSNKDFLILKLQKGI